MTPSFSYIFTLSEVKFNGRVRKNKLQVDTSHVCVVLNLFQGKLLLTCSAADTSMILWNTASESMTPIRRIGGGGKTLLMNF